MNSYETLIHPNVQFREELIASQKSLRTKDELLSAFPNKSFPDVIIFMVVNSEQIHDFLFSTLSNGEIFGRLLPGITTILIMSTCSPSSILSINEKLQEINSSRVKLIDAPVSGGPVKASEGKLSIMLSQQPNTEYSDVPGLPIYKHVLNSLSNEGKSLTLFPTLLGSKTSIGSGSMAKALHQLLAGVHIATSAEVLYFANEVGLDLNTFYNMVTGGAAGNSWMFGDRGKRMIESMNGSEVDIKSRVSIFIKDLSIVLDEARKSCSNNSLSNKQIAPIASSALDCFTNAVKLGLANEDDSALWKVYKSIINNSDCDTVFNDIVDVGNEPLHKLKISNKYTRSFLVQFDEGVSTLAHRHEKDSVYLFLSPRGTHVKNNVMGQPCVNDFMEFGEVRYGYHCQCPLVHYICAEVDGSGGVLCVDAEVLSPPPLLKDNNGNVLNEVESLERHSVIKVREKVRVFKLVLQPGDNILLNYEFFHLIVVSEASDIEITNDGYTWIESKNVGDIQWNNPIRMQQIKNVGNSSYSQFIIQWRNFE